MADITAGSLKRARPIGARFDPVFRILCLSAATTLLAAITGVLVSLLIGGWPAFSKFGLKFFTSTVWNPVTEDYGGAGPIVGTLITATLALLIALPLAFGCGGLSDRVLPPACCAGRSGRQWSCSRACRPSSTACGACSSWRRCSPNMWSCR